MASPSKPRGSTSAQLKNDIDSGRTGDKVPQFDPAAAPLGTDDEAAGTPPSGAEVDTAREQERRPIPAPITPANKAGRKPRDA